MKLSFNPKEHIVTIHDGGLIEFLDLYRAIREWEASFEGITFSHILEGSGNVELYDGSRTPRVMIFVGGWQLSADNPVSIIGGYVAGRDRDGSPRNPIVDDSRDKVKLLDDERVEDEDFVPSEAQVRDALNRAALFREDWEIDVETSTVQRRKDATGRRHSVLGFYWYCKEEWLHSDILRRLRFPIIGDNQIPGRGVIRVFTLSNDWKIPESDLEYLDDGPLLWKENRIVSGPEQDTQEQLPVDKDQVTVGIVTALPKELAAVKSHLKNLTLYRGTHGNVARRYTLGTLPALQGGTHVVALIQCGVGNNSAASRAVMLINEFPNLKYILMVGIAGAVPLPEKVSDHVRLGDVVVSSRHGVIQYDMIKMGLSQTAHRHMPLIPGAALLESVSELAAKIVAEDID